MPDDSNVPATVYAMLGRIEVKLDTVTAALELRVRALEIEAAGMKMAVRVAVFGGSLIGAAVTAAVGIALRYIK